MFHLILHHLYRSATRRDSRGGRSLWSGVNLSWIVVALVAGAPACGDVGQETWTTDSGLKVTRIVEGEGRVPRPGDVLGIVYRASYVDGDEFDRYEDREEPYRFRLGMKQVMPGLEEGCATMRRGEKRVLILPPDLAFDADPGERSNLVPANAWVRFEVELVDVIESPPPPEPWSEVGKDLVVTDTGLQYVDFQAGEGPYPESGSMVVLHYSGFLDDGTLFDTTQYRSAPLAFTFEPGHLIPGMLEGIATMREGGMRKLIIPPHLAYGDDGFRKLIPPGATLTFDLQLLRVELPADSTASG